MHESSRYIKKKQSFLATRKCNRNKELVDGCKKFILFFRGAGFGCCR